MKRLITLLVLIFALPANAAFFSDIEKQDLRSQNLIVNGGCENGKSGITASGGTFTTDDSTPRFGATTCLWDASATAQTLTWNLQVLPTGMYSGRCYILAKQYGGDANYQFQVWDGSTALFTTTLAAQTSFQNIGFEFTCPSSGSITARLLTTGDGAAIRLDNVFLGDLPDRGVVISPLVYSTERSIGTVGAVANEKRSPVTGDFGATVGIWANSLTDSGDLGGNLTAVGGATITGKGFYGDDAFFCDGVDDAFTAADTNHFSNNPVTYAFWARSNEGWRNTVSQTMLSHEESSVLRGVTFFVENDRVDWEGTGTTSAASVDRFEYVLTEPLSSGWHHFASVISGTTGVAYLDGNRVGTWTLDGVLNNSSATMSICAARSATVGFFNGEVRDVVITAEASTDAEINALYARRFSQHQQVAGGHVLDSRDFESINIANNGAFWNLNTDANDGSGNSKNLSAATGTVLYTGLNIFGEIGAAVFDGADALSYSSDDYFLRNDGAFTIATWVAPDSWISGDNQVLSDLKDGSNVWDFRTDISAGGLIRLIIGQGSGSTVTISHDSRTILNGQWTHVAGTYRNGLAKLFVNGSLVGSAIVEITNSGSTATGNQFTIGCRLNTTYEQCFSGKMEQYAYIFKAFSDEDIRRLASARIDRDLSVPSENQDWSASLWTREDGVVKNQLDASFVVDTDIKSLWLNTGLSGGATVNLKMNQAGLDPVGLVSKPFSTGLLSSAPTFPIPHGLPGKPAAVWVRVEGQDTAGKWTTHVDLCEDDDTSIFNCTLPAVNGTHRIEIKASMTSLGESADCANGASNGLLCGSTQAVAGDKEFTGAIKATGGFDTTGGAGLVTATEPGILGPVDGVGGNCTVADVACNGFFTVTPGDNAGSATCTSIAMGGTGNFTKFHDAVWGTFNLTADCAPNQELFVELPIASDLTASVHASGRCDVDDAAVSGAGGPLKAFTALDDFHVLNRGTDTVAARAWRCSFYYRIFL